MISNQQNHFSRPLQWYTQLSLGMHALIVVGLIILSWMSGKMLEERRKKNLQLVQASVRVDMVAMPRLTVKELKALGPAVTQPEAEAPSKTAAAPTVEEASGPEFQVAKKKLSFSEMLKQRAQQRIKKKVIKTKDNSRVDGGDRRSFNNADLKKLVIAGNKLSTGVALVGSNGGEAGSAFSAYITQLPELVRPHWRLPSYLLEKDLKCRIRIWISESGDLLKAEIYEGSGEAEYDQKALDAVRQSAPFPPQEDSFKHRGINGDILLGFPL